MGIFLRQTNIDFRALFRPTTHTFFYNFWETPFTNFSINEVSSEFVVNVNIW